MTEEGHDVAPWHLPAAVARRPDPEIAEVGSWCLTEVVIREPDPDPPKPAPAPARAPAQLER